MTKTTDLPPLREDAVYMLDAVLEHSMVLKELKEIAARHNGVLPSAFGHMIDEGEHCQLGRINMRLYSHSAKVAEDEVRFHEAVAELDLEKLPIVETLERLAAKDAPLADRLGAHEALAEAYVRALSAIIAN